jgi:Putative Ig domain
MFLSRSICFARAYAGICARACGARAVASIGFALTSALLATHAMAVTISPPSLPSGTVGAPYSVVLSASGGEAPYRFVNSVGRLPNGLTLTPAGVLSGTPSAATVPFEIVAIDVNGREATIAASTALFSLPLTVQSSSLPPATVGTSFNGAFVVSGGVGPYSCALASGATLPPGVTLNANCSLSGVPTAPGSFTFGIVVSDSLGASVPFSATLVVNNAAAAVAQIVPLWPATSGFVAVLLVVLLGAGATRRRDTTARDDR